MIYDEAFPGFYPGDEIQCNGCFKKIAKGNIYQFDEHKPIDGITMTQLLCRECIVGASEIAMSVKKRRRSG